MTKKLTLAAFLMGVVLILLAGSILMKNDFLHVYPPVAPKREQPGDPMDAPQDTLAQQMEGMDLLVVVNKRYPLAEEYEPVGLRQANVAVVDGNVMLIDAAASALEEMFAAASADGVSLVCSAGYRSKQRQEALYQSYVDAVDAAYADEVCARPRYSEHETGLAVDLSKEMDEGFVDTVEGQWLAEHAWEHGFVLRYPQGKEEVTGFPFTPGHYRYVGKEAAQAIVEKELTMEEYLDIEGGEYASMEEHE